MDPLTVINLALALFQGGLNVWGQIKGMKSTPNPDGTSTIEMTITVNQAKLDSYLAQQQSDEAALLAEIERRKALEPPAQPAQ